MNKIILFLVLVSCNLYAQKILFSNPILHNNHKKICNNESYQTTQYFSEPIFDIHQNIIVVLPTKRVVKISPIKVYQYGNKTTSVSYSVENEPNSDFVFSKADQIIHGFYSSELGEKIEFQQPEIGVFAASVISEAYFIEVDNQDCTIFPVENIKNSSINFLKANGNICLETTPICENSTIDVLTLYTTDAKNGWGGASQSNAALSTAITNFNIALTNSGVYNLTMNLVYSGEVFYTESGSLSTDLSAFRTNGDGVLDEVHTLRIIHGADVCALVTASPTNTCGLGYLNTNPTNYLATSAFSATVRGCVVGNYSFAHEIGHNLGLRHDWYVDSASNSPCSHQKGYVNQIAIQNGTSSTSSQRWRTILAYNNDCSNAGFNCTRINRWSNPNLNYNSEPTGKPNSDIFPANETFGFLRFGCVVSNFYPTSNLSVFETKNLVNDIRIYPIPTTDYLNIDLPKSYSYTIISPDGKLILNDITNRINLNSLPNGMYFINFYNHQKEFIISKKILKN